MTVMKVKLLFSWVKEQDCFFNAGHHLQYLRNQGQHYKVVMLNQSLCQLHPQYPLRYFGDVSLVDQNQDLLSHNFHHRNYLHSLHFHYYLQCHCFNNHHLTPIFSFLQLFFSILSVPFLVCRLASQHIFQILHFFQWFQEDDSKIIQGM